MNSAYIASVINSTLRSTTPILLAALGCAMCSRVGVFNVALEAQMLIACFTSIAVNYFTSSVLLSVLAGVLSGAVVGAVVAVLQVKYKAADMVVGTALNLLVGAITTFLLYLVFGLRGKLVDNRLVSLNKINLPVIKDIPFLGRVLENLTIIEKISDHESFIIENVDKMIEARKVANKITDEREKAIAYHDTVAPLLEQIRYHVDKLETIVDDEAWPLPKYRELLFIR